MGLVMHYMKQETIAIADTCYRQIVALTPQNVYFSWGVTQIAVTTYKDMPTLVLTVNGFLHQGPVFICYNGGSDLYEVVTVKNHTKEVEEIKHVYEVYAEELGNTIDRLVEKNYSDEEYAKKVNKSLNS